MATSSAGSTNSHFRLLDLHAEIRRMIFEEALSGCEICVRCPDLIELSQPHQLALAQVCRQIRMEAADLQFKDSIVSFESFSDAAIPLTCAQQAVELRFDVEFMELETDLDDFKCAAKSERFGNVRRVVLKDISDHIDMNSEAEIQDKAAVINNIKDFLLTSLCFANIQDLELRVFKHHFGALQVLLDFEVHLRIPSEPSYASFQVCTRACT